MATTAEPPTLHQWQPWRDAWSAALYGPQGFYRTQAPAAHFRTSVHASQQFAAAILRFVRRQGLSAVTDFGAGSGELAHHLHELAPDLTLTAVDVRPRPTQLPADVSWVHELPAQFDGLLFANELLDNIPCDVIERAQDGWRVVEVDVEHGAERLGGPAAKELVDWAQRWWPGVETGGRVEVGLERDRFWSDACGRITTGIALAIDYGHLRDHRPTLGTLRSYRLGREVPVRLDGMHDVTASVAIDSIAAAIGGQVDRQRHVLRELGVSGTRPDLALATTNPARYVHDLARASEAAELLASPGLGDFLWLVGPGPR